MGLCGSKEGAEEGDHSKRVDKIIKKAKETDDRVLKLLLLGAGESGKSTLFKQMIQIYGKGYTDEERMSYTDVIYNNTLSSMKVLILQSEKYGPVTPANQVSKQIIADAPCDKLTPEIADHITKLWQDAGIQATYAQRSKYQLIDSASYFFNDINRLAAAGYIPNEQDVLRSRIRTTGIVETSFVIKDNVFKMLDVGGQRNERKKWIHCFEGVTAVIFVAAMSEYDQVLYEDETTNRMEEALKLFKEICNTRWFVSTSMILFLNKMDLFEEKIKTVDLKVCFKDYLGGCDALAAQQFLEQKFQEEANQGKRQIYIHCTTATNTKNVEHVFGSVSDIIIRKALESSGLL